MNQRTCPICHVQFEAETKREGNHWMVKHLWTSHSDDSRVNGFLDGLEAEAETIDFAILERFRTWPA